MNWEDVIRAVPLVAAAVGSVVAAIIKIRASRPAKKAQLERDLTLLERLSTTDLERLK
jgi:hypothetical protein